MQDRAEGPYIISGRKGKKRSGGAALFVIALILVSGAVCAAVFLLGRDGAADTPARSDVRYYCLVTGESTVRTEAALRAKESAERGGAGYIYNDGVFRIISAVYESEADVRALVSVNAGASYISLDVPVSVGSDAEDAALGFLAGEWSRLLFEAASELDRGNMTEAAADLAVRRADARLLSLADGTDGAVRRVIERACEYSPAEDGRTLLSYIRFVHVRGIAAACELLG